MYTLNQYNLDSVDSEVILGDACYIKPRQGFYKVFFSSHQIKINFVDVEKFVITYDITV